MPIQREKLYEVREQNKKTIYDQVLEYMREKYSVRYDDIGHDFEISFKEKDHREILDDNSFLIELAQANIEITPAKLEIFFQFPLLPEIQPFFQRTQGFSYLTTLSIL